MVYWVICFFEEYYSRFVVRYAMDYTGLSSVLLAAVMVYWVICFFGKYYSLFVVHSAEVNTWLEVFSSRQCGYTKHFHGCFCMFELALAVWRTYLSSSPACCWCVMLFSGRLRDSSNRVVCVTRSCFGYSMSKACMQRKKQSARDVKGLCKGYWTCSDYRMWEHR